MTTITTAIPTLRHHYDGSMLYHNNRNGTFSDVTTKARVQTAGWTSSAGFFDYDNDGRLDLFVVGMLTGPSLRTSIAAQQRRGGAHIVTPTISARFQLSVSQQWRWNFYRCQREESYSVQQG